MPIIICIILLNAARIAIIDYLTRDMVGDILLVGGSPKQ